MFRSADNSDPVDGADPFRISPNDPEALKAGSSIAIIPDKIPVSDASSGLLPLLISMERSLNISRFCVYGRFGAALHKSTTRYLSLAWYQALKPAV